MRKYNIFADLYLFIIIPFWIVVTYILIEVCKFIGKKLKIWAVKDDGIIYIFYVFSNFSIKLV